MQNPITYSAAFEADMLFHSLFICQWLANAPVIHAINFPEIFCDKHSISFVSYIRVTKYY